MNYVIGQKVAVTHLFKGEEIESKGEIIWDYGNGIYDVQTESGQIVHESQDKIYPIAEYINFVPPVSEKMSVEQELKQIEERKKYLIAILNEQPEGEVPETIETPQSELTVDHTDNLLTPAKKTFENNQSVSELLHKALEIIEKDK